MVHPFLIGSTLLRTKQSILPRTFCRYKSITAAIERGRQGGPDRPSRPQSRNTYADAGDRSNKNRFERRLDRFGAPYSAGKKKFPSAESREDRPRSDGYERVTERRSSRFGRVGLPRPRDDAPSRFREERPPRNERAEGGRFDRERRPSSDRDNGDHDSGTDRAPRRDRFDAQGDRPPRPERSSDNRDSRKFNNDRSSTFGKPRTFNNDRGDRPRTPYADRNASSDPTAGRSGDNEGFRFDRPSSALSQDSASPYTRKPRDAHDGPPRESRFSRADSKGARRERSRTGPYERSYSNGQTDSPSGSASKTVVPDVESLPYTTAASEFIYGHSSVVAALKAQKRKFYNLYIHPRGANRANLLARIRGLKLFSITKEVGDEYKFALGKASNGRPHNGIVLEASVLPVPPITELKSPSLEDETFGVALDRQSAEEALVNGEQEVYPYRAAGWRHPLILYLDGILDEGNLGAIARSAYFLGVDAVVTSTRQSAPWSHITLKASAGAAEAIPIFKVGEPTDFLGKSSRAGWRIYASGAVTPEHSTAASTSESPTAEFSHIVYTLARSSKRLPRGHCPVAEHPTILMMGAEGTGLRIGLLNAAHYTVGIQQVRDADEIDVDSMNVSDATSILCYEMLKQPRSKRQAASPAPKEEEEALF